jgi:hypothetical protein
VPELCAIPQRKSPGFSDRLAVVPDLLGAETFAGIKAGARAKSRANPGGTVAYETISRLCRAELSFMKALDEPRDVLGRAQAMCKQECITVP